MRKFLLALGLLIAGALGSGAHAACPFPNPNLGPPSNWVDNCPLPASSLVAALQGIQGATPSGVGDGVADDGASLQALFNSGNAVVSIPSKTYRSSIQLTIPDYVSVIGQGYRPNAYGGKGAIIQCDAAVVGACVVVGNGDNKPNILANLTISRGAGTQPANATCIDIPGGQQVYLTHVECYNHAIGFQTDASGVNGIYTVFDHVQTCKISDAHFVVNGVPGVYSIGSIIGCNGNGGLADVNGNDYVRITGNWDNTKGTVHFTDTQFNVGQNSVVCAFDFKNFTGVTNIFFDFEVMGGHVETAQNVYCSDNTVKGISLNQLIGVFAQGGWGGTNLLWKLDPATTPLAWAWSSDTISGFTGTLAPTAGYDDFKIGTTSFANTPLSFTAGASNSVNLEGNEYQGLTLSGNWQGPGSRITGLARAGGGTYAYTFTGNLELDITNNSLAPCSAALAFAGGSGLTQTLNSCKWQISGSYVDATVNITVTALGTSSGNATLTGLPQPANTTALSMSPCYNINTAGLASASVNGFLANPTGTTANLYTQAATSVQPMTVANFTGTSQFSCSLHYPLSQ